MSRKLKTWYTNASAEDKARVAKAAGLRRSYLSQLAHGHRQVKVAGAVRLENAIVKLDPASGITRADIVPECAKCPFYLACKKGK